MLLAIIIGMLIVVSSGQAISIANKQASEYVSRYSLERRANDIADLLVRSPGIPKNWEENPDKLETPGLATVRNEDEPIPNKMDPDKLLKLANEIKTEPIDENIKESFGTKKFEIEIRRKNSILWRIWPGWSEESLSGKENSLEVVSVERYIYGNLVEDRAETPPIIRGAGLEIENLKFFVHPGELEIYDWYIYLEQIDEINGANPIKINVNRPVTEGNFDYNIGPNEVSDDGYELRPEDANGLEDDPGVDNAIKPGETNYISVKFTGNPKSLKVYLVAIPSDFDSNIISSRIHETNYTIKVSVWR